MKLSLEGRSLGRAGYLELAEVLVKKEEVEGRRERVETR